LDLSKYAIISDADYPLQEAPGVTWSFKPPIAQDEVEISKFMNDGPVTAGSGSVTRVIKTGPEIAIQELALLFGGTTISKGMLAKLHKQPEPDDKDDPILLPGDDIATKRKVIGSLPSPLYWELWRALGVRCPGWGMHIHPDDVPDDGNDLPKEEKS
jgi:hypothetical protein